MNSLQASLPRSFEGYIRAEYLRDLQDLHGYAVRFYADTIISEEGAPLQFSGWLENGAPFERAPISALVTQVNMNNEEVFPGSTMPMGLCWNPTPMHEHQPWNCFSDDFSVLVRDGWQGRAVHLRVGSEWLRGSYLYTVDWPARSTGYGHMGHKCAHVIAGDDGNVYAYPNNLLCLLDPATVSRPFSVTGEVPQITCRTYSPSCEAHGGHAGDGDEFHYEVKPSGPLGAMPSEAAMHVTMAGKSRTATSVPRPGEESSTEPDVARLHAEMEAVRMDLDEERQEHAVTRDMYRQHREEFDALRKERDALSLRLATSAP